MRQCSHELKRKNGVVSRSHTSILLASVAGTGRYDAEDPFAQSGSLFVPNADKLKTTNSNKCTASNWHPNFK